MFPPRVIGVVAPWFGVIVMVMHWKSLPFRTVGSIPLPGSEAVDL
jgi:hypothetical protein